MAGQMQFDGKVLALSGGVGGAKLALGLAQILTPEQLTIVANTGDDFEHFGLHISPDLDTLMYTLAGLSNTETGWGRANETWTFMSAIEKLGGETWFNLGDGDLATHITRRERLAAGHTLTEVTAYLCSQLGVMIPILPMSDEPVRTMVNTVQGDQLPFQEYFVKRRCEPEVNGFYFQGIEDAEINPAVRIALNDPELQTVIICPSNPFISIDPILALPGLRQLLRETTAVVIAISPIIAGQAVKGPTTKMMQELDMTVTSVAIADYYDDMLQGFVIDIQDGEYAKDISQTLCITDTLMNSLLDKQRLAEDVLQFAEKLRKASSYG